MGLRQMFQQQECAASEVQTIATNVFIEEQTWIAVDQSNFFLNVIIFIVIVMVVNSLRWKQCKKDKNCSLQLLLSQWLQS